MSLRILPELEQRSEEWYAQRRGIVTASAVGKLLTVGAPDALTVECPTCEAAADSPCISAARKVPTPIKIAHDTRAAKASTLPPVYEVAENDTSRGLTAILAAERITGWTEEGPMTSDMWRGVESEPYARDLYSGHHEQAVECGFMVREEDGWTLGYSPDGLVGDDGLVEIKAPRAKTQLQTILADQVPAQHMPQCQAGLLVSGRKWIDFVSFCGGMPLFVKRVLPDPEWHAAIEAACRAFEISVAALVADYSERVEGLPVAERIPDLELVI